MLETFRTLGRLKKEADMWIRHIISRITPKSAVPSSNARGRRRKRGMAG